MSDLDTGAPEGAAEPVTVVNVPADTPDRLSLREAARVLREARKPKESPTEFNAKVRENLSSAAAPAEAVEAQPEESPAQADDAAPQDEVPGETQEAEPAAQPPIEPPRSWTKEARERWQSLPRETQEYLAEREQERDREVRRSQNEHAEKLKGLSAKEQALEMQRAQYEQALPVVLSNLQSGLSAEFSDIKTMADVQRMATEDWPRYVRWDAAQKQLAAVQQEMTEAERRRGAERSQKWNDYTSKEDQLFHERVPEMADAKKAAELRDAAIKTLEDTGFTKDELAKFWNESDVFRDHRMQLIILDAVKYRASKAKAKAIEAKPLPKVQQPGTAKARGEADAARLQALNQQLDNASGINALRIAAKLTAEKRRAG